MMYERKLEVERTFSYTFQTRIWVAKLLLLLLLFIVAFQGDERHTFRHSPFSAVPYFRYFLAAVLAL